MQNMEAPKRLVHMETGVELTMTGVLAIVNRILSHILENISKRIVESEINKAAWIFLLSLTSDLIER